MWLRGLLEDMKLKKWSLSALQRTRVQEPIY